MEGRSLQNATVIAVGEQGKAGRLTFGSGAAAARSALLRQA
jgi:hypothetical protein